jgi:hypothetical protein
VSQDTKFDLKSKGKSSVGRKEKKEKETLDAKQEKFQSIKYRAYCMLYDIIMNKEKILKHLDLPTYRIPWIREPQLK